MGKRVSSQTRREVLDLAHREIEQWRRRQSDRPCHCRPRLEQRLAGPLLCMWYPHAETGSAQIGRPSTQPSDTVSDSHPRFQSGNCDFGRRLVRILFSKNKSAFPRSRPAHLSPPGPRQHKGERNQEIQRPWRKRRAPAFFDELKLRLRHPARRPGQWRRRGSESLPVGPCAILCSHSPQPPSRRSHTTHAEQDCAEEGDNWRAAAGLPLFE
jgi:hypothetical protein